MFERHPYVAFRSEPTGSMVIVCRITAQDPKHARKAIRQRYPSATHYAAQGQEPEPITQTRS